MLKTLLNLSFLVATVSAANAEVLVDPSIRVYLNNRILNNSINELETTRYRATYKNNGWICTSAQLEVTVSEIGYELGGLSRYTDGSRSAYLFAEVSGRGAIVNCSIPGVDFGCRTFLEPWAIEAAKSSGEGVLSLDCSVDLPVPNRPRIEEQIEFSMPMRVNPPDEVTFSDDTTNGPNFNFLEADDSGWSTSPTPKSRRLRSNVVSTGMLGQQVVSVPHKFRLLDSKSSQWLMLGLDVGGRSFSFGSSADEIERSERATLASFGSYPVVLSVSEEFLIGNESAPFSGVVGALFPFQITGRDEAFGLPLEYSLVVAAGSSRFSETSDGFFITLELEASDPVVRNAATGRTLPVDSVEGIVVLGPISVLPSTGQLDFAIKSASVLVDVPISSEPYEIEIDVSQLNDHIERSLKRAYSIKSEFNARMPECINAGEERFRSRDINWNSVVCPGQNSDRGFLFNVDQHKSFHFAFDLSRPELRLIDGTLYFLLPEKDL